MNPLDIIEKYYNRNSKLYNILLDHSNSVTEKALEIAQKHPELGIDTQFVREATMLHDVGIFMTNAPSIECFGSDPYMAHGYIGHDLLMKEGYPKHALVCERHTGAGLTLDEIVTQNLPIPHREMMPISIEEQVICFADCFFSKTNLGKEKPIDKIVSKLARYGARSPKQFLEWSDLFLS